MKVWQLVFFRVVYCANLKFWAAKWRNLQIYDWLKFFKYETVRQLLVHFQHWLLCKLLKHWAAKWRDLKRHD